VLCGMLLNLLSFLFNSYCSLSSCYSVPSTSLFFLCREPSLLSPICLFVFLGLLCSCCCLLFLLWVLCVHEENWQAFPLIISSLFTPSLYPFTYTHWPTELEIVHPNLSHPHSHSHSWRYMRLFTSSHSFPPVTHSHR